MIPCTVLLLLSATTMTPQDTGPPQLVVTIAPPAPEWKQIDPTTPIGELTCLTKRTATVVHGRLVYLDLYPGLCQNAMDQLGDVLTRRCVGQRAIDASTCESKVAAVRQAGWRPLEIVGVAAGALVTGYLLGRLLH